MKLQTIKLGLNWFITGDEDDGPYGPYDSKGEADEDRKGLNKARRHINDHEFWTSEKVRNETTPISI